MSNVPVNILEKFELFSEVWTPKVVAELDNIQFKLARLDGEFVWHKHDETDEAFFVVKGALTIDFRDRSVVINEGELFVVPKGIEHRPHATAECLCMIIEPRGVVNTGNAESPLTAPNDEWI